MKNLERCLVALCAIALWFCAFSCKKASTISSVNNTVSQTLPAFNPIGGFYKSAQTVSISCDGAQEIYYKILTADEVINDQNLDPPSENDTLYTEPFEISEQCIIRALAVKEDGSKNYAMTCFDFDLDRSTDFAGTTIGSPEWQDQIIYFILTDRFYNGNSSNDKISGLTDQNGNLYDESLVLSGQPASGYNGGDLAGIEAKLDYIQTLGCTAIWITPPIKNQVAEGNYHGYHGYWASDFTKVDEHMGELAEYQSLVSAAHDRGMYVIQDIVVNHTGDYQKISAQVSSDMIDAGTVSSVFSLNGDSVPYKRPEQLPWGFNDPENLTADEFNNDSFYHFNPYISNFTDSSQRYEYQSSDLDDINTENEVVRNLLRGYFRYWIDKTNIDGYRIDTVYYVEEDFFEDFINSSESGNMGIRPYASALGKSDFLNFGEAWSTDETIVSGYTQSYPGKAARLDSVIYFPLRFAITDTISGGTKTSAISDVLQNRYKTSSSVHYADPDRLVTFIDNHDVERFASVMNGNEPLIKAAYAIIFTIPGIPQIYYGNEQGFDGECRAGMFSGSFKSDGTTQTQDYFDTDGDWFKFYQNLIQMRKDYRVFRYNTLYVLEDTDDSAGLFAYVVREKDSSGSAITDGSQYSKAVFIMNTASGARVVNSSYTNLAEGDRFILLSDVSACETGDTLPSEFTVTSGGQVNCVMPGNSYGVYILEESGTTVDTADHTVSITSVPSGTISGNSATIAGEASAAGTVYIVLNSDYTNATQVTLTEDALTFSVDADVSSLSNGSITVQLILESDDGYTVYSSTSKFTISRPYTLVSASCVTDPIGDDYGVGAAQGTVQLPTDSTFGGQLDIVGVDVYRSGNDIRLGVKMDAISQTWNPTSNLFDHVIFHIFISDGDDSTGCAYHPNYNYELPDGFTWDYMYQANGWGAGYYSSSGATATSNGKAVTPAPANSPAVDWTIDADGDGYVDLDWSSYSPSEEWADEAGMIWFTISAASMGYPSDISGYKFYINTYDFDMGSPRGMVEGNAEQWKFGSGSTALDDTPRVIDETSIIVID